MEKGRKKGRGGGGGVKQKKKAAEVESRKGRERGDTEGVKIGNLPNHANDRIAIRYRECATSNGENLPGARTLSLDDFEPLPKEDLRPKYWLAVSAGGK